MEFVSKKVYKKDKIVKKYYIDNQEVDEWTFDTLDNDAFEKLKNIKPHKNVVKINSNTPSDKLISQTVAEPDEYKESLKDLINDMKIFTPEEAMQCLLVLLDSVGKESYDRGYLDGILNLRDDLTTVVAKLVKKSTRRSK